MSASTFYIHILIIDLSPKRIFSQLYNGLKGHAYNKVEEKVGSTTINIDTTLPKKEKEKGEMWNPDHLKEN